MFQKVSTGNGSKLIPDQESADGRKIFRSDRVHEHKDRVDENANDHI